MTQWRLNKRFNAFGLFHYVGIRSIFANFSDIIVGHPLAFIPIELSFYLILREGTSSLYYPLPYYPHYHLFSCRLSRRTSSLFHPADFNVTHFLYPSIEIDSDWKNIGLLFITPNLTVRNYETNSLIESKFYDILVCWNAKQCRQL